MAWTLEQLSAWCAHTGLDLCALADAAFPQPNHGTDSEFDQWAFYQDRLLAQCQQSPLELNADQRKAVEAAMNRLADKGGGAR